jgi:hypothetical protein
VDQGFDIVARAAGYVAYVGQAEEGGFFFGPVLVCDAEGNFVGRGEWNGDAIEDCEALLGEAVYQALDEAIAKALEKKQGL